MRFLLILAVLTSALAIISTPSFAIEPGDVVINEVAPDETSSRDWLELYNSSGSSINIQSWVVKQKTSIRKTFPYCTLSPGEYIVLHFHGKGTADETGGDTNANGHRDFYYDTGSDGLTGTDEVVILEDSSGNIVDAIAFANNDGTWASTQHTAFTNIVAANEWTATVYPNDTEENKRKNEGQCADWSEGAKGKSLGRDVSSADTDSRADWHLFTSQTAGAANPTMGTPGDVLINEVAPSEDNDWIEFYNTSAGSVDIRYWVVKERTSVVKAFPAYTMTPGEYIVLNFEGDPADDEVAGDTNGNGYRDFYTADSGLTGTDNVIILEDGASTMIDAMAFANNDGTWASSQQNAFNAIVAAGHWEGTDDGEAGVNEAESANWGEGGEGKCLGRDSSSTDTNSKADWHLFTSHTPGEANPVLGNPGEVLINEVAPGEGKDWIEFCNVSGEDINIQYWLVRERSTVVKTFPDYTAGPEEYFVLHFEGDPADDEIAGDTNGNGYRDFYTADSGLTGTDNVIILEDGASTMIDAMAFANNDGGWAGAQQTAFNTIVQADHWEGTLDGGAEINEPEAADWSEGVEGKSLGRDAWSKDMDSKTDWYLALQTKGEVNPGWPYSVTLTADPVTIPADGVSTSAIRATVKDRNNNPVADGTMVVFATDLGTLISTTAETIDGMATVMLTSGTVPGQARVSARSLSASGQVSVQLAFIPTQIGACIQLPAIDHKSGWETLIQAQNVGDEETGAILFFWGEYSGLCPRNDPGPIGVACMRIPENAVWTLKAQIPALARSAIVYSVDKDSFDVACEDAADTVGDSDEWKDWEDDYQDTGEPVVVIAQRQGPNDYGTVVSSAYTGIAEDMEGPGPPCQYFAPYAMRQYFNLDTEIIIQNSGQRCTSVWLHYGQQGEDCTFTYSEHIEQLAPGESIRKRVPEVVGMGWLGSVYVTANEPLGIIMDQTSFPPSVDQGVLLTYRARPYQLITDTLFFADLVWRELSGWEASIQVQNLTQESLPTFVTVEFFDNSGDSILFLGDWVCPAGGATFYLPAIAGLGVEYAGAAVIQSHSQVGYPSGEETDGQPIFAVVDLKKAGMDAQGGSYNAYAESEMMGATAIALPFLSRDHQGVTSLIAVRNNANCNDIKLRVEMRDETGAIVGFVDDFWLRAGHLKLMDLAGVDSVVPGFAGAGIAEVTDVQQLCDTDGDGGVDQTPIMPSVVMVNRGTGPGDVTWVYEGIPVR
jgi:hypothetical protein